MADNRRRHRLSQPLKFLTLAVVVALLGVATAISGHSMLTRAGVLAPRAASTIPSTLYSPTPSAGLPGGDGTVGPAPAGSTTAAPDAAALAARIAAVKGRPGTLGGLVIDPASGATLYSSNPTGLLMPASNLKVLTGLALLDSTDAGTRYATTVVATGKGRIVLVGGGDPYLRSTPASGSTTAARFASTQVLASRTAAALKKAGTTSVTLGYDASLFTGPSWSPNWPSTYADQVTHISALWVDEGVDASTGTRAADPAAAAATTFATQLKAAGITVTGTPAATTVPRTGTSAATTSTPSGAGSTPASSGVAEVARVESAPVEDLLATALLHSDNSATEVLSRHMALASGEPATFVGAAAALQKRLRALGVWQDGAVVQDGCGLSRGNRVSARMLARVWRVALATPRLRPMTTGLPVSAVAGSLSDRFTESGAVAGRGVVNAKTGTLTGVSSLSGWVRAADGRVLVEAFILNDAADVDAARSWLDLASAAVAAS